jgi:uncharacterized protein (TIGR02265 family)
VARADPDVVLAFPARVTPARHARSTILMASIETVRSRGLFAEYERALPAQYKEELLGAVAATWMPLEAALAHYAACDSLGLTAEQHVQCGRSTFDGARGTLLGTAVRMARGAGLTPWTTLPLLQRFWDRGFDGGAVSVARAGPKDAHVTCVQCAVIVSPYFRNGLRGLLAALMELTCTKAYVTERRSHLANSLSFRLQWA